MELGRTSHGVDAANTPDRKPAREVPPGTEVFLTDRRLTPQKIKALKLRPNTVCLLREAKNRQL